VGGYNSSNTTHLVELLEQKFPTYFIKDANEILSDKEVRSFNIHTKEIESINEFISHEIPRIAITSGASCPDSVVDRVIQKILELKNVNKSIDEIVETITTN